MFEVTVEDSFDFRSKEYAELFASSPRPLFSTPFGSPCCTRRSSGMVGHAADHRRAHRRKTGNGPAAGQAPLHVAEGREFADMRVSDYISPVTDEETFLRIVADVRALAAIRKHLKPYDLLRIGKLADRSLPIERLFGIDKRKAWA